MEGLLEQPMIDDMSLLEIHLTTTNTIESDIKAKQRPPKRSTLTGWKKKFVDRVSPGRKVEGLQPQSGLTIKNVGTQ